MASRSIGDNQLKRHDRYKVDENDETQEESDKQRQQKRRPGEDDSKPRSQTRISSVTASSTVVHRHKRARSDNASIATTDVASLQTEEQKARNETDDNRGIKYTVSATSGSHEGSELLGAPESIGQASRTHASIDIRKTSPSSSVVASLPTAAPTFGGRQMELNSKIARLQPVLPKGDSKSSAVAKLPVLAPYPVTGAVADFRPHAVAGFPKTLSAPEDESSISPYQSYIRKQLEFFLVQTEDFVGVINKRTKLVANQVGVRCRHCAFLPAKDRAKGAVCFPTSLLGIYQSVQSLAKDHLVLHCPFVPADVVEEVLRLGKEKPRMKQGGKSYWAARARELGIRDHEGRLFAA